MAAPLGFKTFATGDVLTAADTNGYLMQGVWTFASAAARDAAVTSPQEGNMCYLKDTDAVQSYSGSAWVAVGASSNTFYAGKNKIINGAFNVWQRGLTNLTNFGAVGCNADRWSAYIDGTGTKTVSAQTFTPGAAPVAGYESQYFMRYNQTVAGTGGTENNYFQAIEDVRTFAGQTATLSFWMKADAARSVTPYIVQRFGTGGSSAVTNNGSAVSVTTSWQRFTATFTVASISGKTIGTNSLLEVGFRLPNNVVQTIDIWGVQLEAGSTATDFQTASGSLGGELALCQRYFYAVTGDGVNQGAAPVSQFGIATGTASAQMTIPLPVTMRTAPSFSTSSTTGFRVYDALNAAVATTNITLAASASQPNAIMIAVSVASGLTQYRPYYLIPGASVTNYLYMSAEL
jgi:hypothetical protein